MVKNPDLDLSCHDDEDEPVEEADGMGKTIDAEKEIEKVAKQVKGS